MKKISWLFAAILPVFLLVASCEKQIASDVTATGGRNPEMRVGCGTNETPIPANFFTLTTSPSPAVAGQPVEVCLSVAQGGMTAFYIYDTQGTPGTGDDVLAASSTGGGQTPQRCASFTPEASNCSGTSNYRIVISYANAGGSDYCLGSVEALAISSLCIPVEAEACTDAEALTITGSAVVSDVSEGWATITATYCVTACKAVAGVRVQGGATAGGNVGATEISWSDHSLATAGYPNYANNNIVYSWTKDFAAGETKCFTFSYRRAFTACGEITGDWSAKSANGLSVAEIESLEGCPE
jgi:hypothetical protein